MIYKCPSKGIMSEEDVKNCTSCFDNMNDCEAVPVEDVKYFYVSYSFEDRHGKIGFGHTTCTAQEKVNYAEFMKQAKEKFSFRRVIITHISDITKEEAEEIQNEL